MQAKLRLLIFLYFLIVSSNEEKGVIVTANNVINAKKAAEICQCSYPTIIRWLNSGKMKGEKGPGGWRLLESEARRFIPKPKEDLGIES